MKYKGSNKHSIEELEEIKEDLLDNLNEQRIDAEYDNKLLSNLSELVRDIYFDCSRKFEDEITATLIFESLKTNLAQFAKDNNFNL